MTATIPPGGTTMPTLTLPILTPKRLTDEQLLHLRRVSEVYGALDLSQVRVLFAHIAAVEAEEEAGK